MSEHTHLDVLLDTLVNAATIHNEDDQTECIARVRKVIKAHVDFLVLDAQRPNPIKVEELAAFVRGFILMRMFEFAESVTLKDLASFIEKALRNDD